MIKLRRDIDKTLSCDVWPALWSCADKDVGLLEYLITYYQDLGWSVVRLDPKTLAFADQST